MNEMTSRLRRKLEDSLAELSNEQIAALIEEARDEALAEAKAVIKGTMVQAILERALGEIQNPKPALSPGEVPKAQSPKLTSETSLLDSEEQIQQEIEAIRKKIAENERLLSQVKASPVKPVLERSEGTEEVQGPPAGQELSAPSRGEEDHGYYVYGVVSDVGKTGFPKLPEEGIDPAHPVYALQPSAISHHPSAISAIVSKVSLQEFGQEALEANLEDIKWVEAKVLAHQRILDQVLAHHTLIPMRFCTIYQSEGRVQEMLAQHYDDFVAALARLEGKKEWGVKVYCDGKTLAQRVGEISDRVKELKAEMEQRSSGAAYFLKKKVDEAIAAEVEHVSDEYAQRSHDRLSGHAEETIINPLRSREITGRNEAMVLNGAYLVAEEQLTAFRAELESLEQEYGDLGFIYEMTGPWPPYNFVSIGLEESSADERVGG